MSDEMDVDPEVNLNNFTRPVGYENNRYRYSKLDYKQKLVIDGYMNDIRGMDSHALEKEKKKIGSRVMLGFGYKHDGKKLEDKEASARLEAAKAEVKARHRKRKW